MKQLLVTTALLLTTYLFSAAAIDNYGRLVRSARQVATRGAVDRAAAYYPAIIQLDSEDVAVDGMTADGVRVLRRRDEFVLAFALWLSRQNRQISRSALCQHLAALDCQSRPCNPDGRRR